MDNHNVQKATQKWIKIYSRMKDAELLEVWKDDFHERSTPRRDEDQGRKKALIALLGNLIDGDRWLTLK
jgi:hypothetical protein